MYTGKTVLVVDDSEIDRTVLQAMLCDEFEVIQKSGGYSAVEFLTEGTKKVDALLLDVSMPGMDGFEVLQCMKEAEIDDIPVFLITSEATRDNVEKATQYGISGFIRKPFEGEDIIRRLKPHLGIIEEYELTEKDITETKKYIKELGMLLRRHLINFREDEGHYSRIVVLMKILLKKYAELNDVRELDEERIGIISKAGYFCDIGFMVVPSRTVKIFKIKEASEDGFQYHTTLGAELVALNHSKSCRYFVEVCTEICMHHHERYDGKGFPHRIIGSHNQIYTQICRLADRFDTYFMKYHEHNDRQFEYVVSDIENDKGFVGMEVLCLLSFCKMDITRFYQTME